MTHISITAEEYRDFARSKVLLQRLVTHARLGFKGTPYRAALDDARAHLDAHPLPPLLHDLLKEQE